MIEDPYLPFRYLDLATPSAGTSWPTGCRLTRMPDGGVAPAPLGIVGEFFFHGPHGTESGLNTVFYTRLVGSRPLLSTGAVAVGDAIYTAADGLVANTQATESVFVGTAQTSVPGAGLVQVA